MVAHALARTRVRKLLIYLAEAPLLSSSPLLSPTNKKQSPHFSTSKPRQQHIKAAERGGLWNSFCYNLPSV